MNLLLDTHVVLWAFAEPDRLGKRTHSMITDPRHTINVSAATIWEMEIKRAIGRLDAPDDAIEMCDRAGFDELPLSMTHAQLAGRLPHHHTDPFDRMLIAQALEEGLDIVTVDRAFDDYEVTVRSAFD